MTSNPVFRGLLLVAALALAACQQQPGSVDYNPDTAFDRYQSYAWLAESSGAGSDVEPLLAERVQRAVDEVMERRGHVRQSGEADMLLRYYLVATARTRDQRSRGSIGVGGGRSHVGMGISMGFPLGGSRVKQRLQLTIDVLDGDSERLVWRGVRELALPDNRPDASRAAIQRAVEDTLSRFPPSR